jgi:23S rRNA G2069 N7-methylase RlmK/C1962 C5-methylase RlmI
LGFIRRLKLTLTCETGKCTRPEEAKLITTPARLISNGNETQQIGFWLATRKNLAAAGRRSTGIDRVSQ